MKSWHMQFSSIIWFQTIILCNIYQKGMFKWIGQVVLYQILRSCAILSIISSTWAYCYSCACIYSINLCTQHYTLQFHLSYASSQFQFSSIWKVSFSAQVKVPIMYWWKNFTATPEHQFDPLQVAVSNINDFSGY